MGRKLVVLGALLLGLGIGYWAHPTGTPPSDSERDQIAEGLHRDVAPDDVGALGIGLTDGEWWANEKSFAAYAEMKGGRGKGVIVSGNRTMVFEIRLAKFELIDAKVQFLVAHDGEVATWLGTLDLGDPEAPVPTESELEAERHEVIPMTIRDVYGRFCAEMTPFRLWRKYPGRDLSRLRQLRQLIAEVSDVAKDR